MPSEKTASKLPLTVFASMLMLIAGRSAFIFSDLKLRSGGIITNLTIKHHQLRSLSNGLLQFSYGNTFYKLNDYINKLSNIFNLKHGIFLLLPIFLFEGMFNFINDKVIKLSIRLLSSKIRFFEINFIKKI